MSTRTHLIVELWAADMESSASLLRPTSSARFISTPAQEQDESFPSLISDPTMPLR